MNPQQPVSRRGWTGTTKNTQESGAMLGAKWWAKGDDIHCLFQRTFETKFGTGHEFLLIKPQTLTVNVDQFGSTTKKGDGEQRILTRFAVPPLAGFTMALQDLQTSGFPGLRFGDRCILKCVDIQESQDFGFSAMPLFEISVDTR